jgi:hypothetical protein
MTATVKLFLKKPMEKPQQLIQLVLTYATQETDNPDLRDRAYIYWRLLSTDPGAGRAATVTGIRVFWGQGGLAAARAVLRCYLHPFGHVQRLPKMWCLRRSRLSAARKTAPTLPFLRSC